MLLNPLGSGTYLLDGVGTAAAKPVLGRSRVADPTRFPYTTLVLFGAARVDVVGEFGDQPERDSAREFVAWLAGRQPCRVVDEHGRDLTGWASGGEGPAAVVWIPDWYDQLPALGPRLVLDFPAGVSQPVDSAAVAWRLEWSDGATAEPFAELLERLLDRVGELRGLVIGVSEPWCDPAELTELTAVPLLESLAPRMPHLTGLALFDIVSFDDQPVRSRHTPVDIPALLAAFPNRGTQHVCVVRRL